MSDNTTRPTHLYAVEIAVNDGTAGEPVLRWTAFARCRTQEIAAHIANSFARTGVPSRSSVHPNPDGEALDWTEFLSKDAADENHDDIERLGTRSRGELVARDNKARASLGEISKQLRAAANQIDNDFLGAELRDIADGLPTLALRALTPRHPAYYGVQFDSKAQVHADEAAESWGVRAMRIDGHCYCTRCTNGEGEVSEEIDMAGLGDALNQMFASMELGGDAPKPAA